MGRFLYLDLITFIYVVTTYLTIYLPVKRYKDTYLKKRIAWHKLATELGTKKYC